MTRSIRPCGKILGSGRFPAKVRQWLRQCTCWCSINYCVRLERQLRIDFMKDTTIMVMCTKPQGFILSFVSRRPLSLSLLNSSRWLNTVTGDETGLTSQFISTPSLATQPMKGCTRPPGSTNSSLGSFTPHKNQSSERAVRRGVRFSVLVRED